MEKYLGNAFSLQMLKKFPCEIKVEEVSEAEALSEYTTSVIGHQDTANVLGVPFNRTSVILNEGDFANDRAIKSPSFSREALTL